MYSHEIEQTLKNNNYNIDSNTYLNICNTSPQIKYVVYDTNTEQFIVDTHDNFQFKFKVYLKQ